MIYISVIFIDGVTKIHRTQSIKNSHAHITLNVFKNYTNGNFPFP